MAKNLGKINLLSCIVTPDINSLNRFNSVVAWNLAKAFKKLGYKSNFVYTYKPTSRGVFLCRWLDNKNYHQPRIPPKADHTIAISGESMLLLRGTGRGRKQYTEEIKKAAKKYRQKIEAATSGKIAIYLDADYGGWAEYFDHVFTLVKPKANAHKKYVYAGWGADPEYFYPEQTEKAIYLDCLMYDYYKGKHNKIYDTYKQVLSDSKLKVYNPLETYHGTPRISWPELQKILRKCHFYCLTQPGEGGLTRIEAATCGALLVVPEAFSKLRSISSLEHKVWKTKEDLSRILKTETDPQVIRKKALEHSWDKVASRILETLYE